MGFRRNSLAACTGAVLLLASVVAATPAAALDAAAPRVENARGELTDRAILVTGYGRWDNRDDPPLRTAQPLVDPSQWFAGNSALAEAHRADPMASRYATFVLDITAQGTIAACRYSEGSRVVVDEAALCAEIKQQRFLPQLANDGTRVSGQYRLSLSNREFAAQPGAPERPLFTAERDRRPLPAPAPRARDIDAFPPNDFELSYLYRAPIWQTAPNPGWGHYPRDETRTGLLLYRDGEGRACRVLEPSGDAQRDAAACRYAQTALAPDWSAVEGNRDWIVPLYILHRTDGLVAIGPDPDRIRETHMTAEMDAALADALMRGGVLPEGRRDSPLGLSFASSPVGWVEHCRVVKTTGDDARDIAACRIASEAVRMHPAEDIFGTPQETAGMFWWAGSRPN